MKRIVLTFKIAWACSLLSVQSLHAENLSSEQQTFRVEGGYYHWEEPIRPIIPVVIADPRKALLGEKLFHDTRLSADNTISCNDCHNLEKFGADDKPKSMGINNTLGSTNAPTVFNTVFNIAQLWDGQADTLLNQVELPIHNEKEMGSNWQQVIAKLKKDREYRTAFGLLYPQGITADSIADAIATFESSLTTPGSRFDRFLLGEENAISEREKQGYALFKSYGCIACHQGVNVGGNMFQTMGLMGNYFKDRNSVTEADFGRYNVTGLEADRYVFKVPSLRFAVKTPPYFHDGSAQTLDEAIIIMARYQLGRTIPMHDVQLIKAFLNTLVGEYQRVIP